MDMKRILQALDGASTKPVEGANDMARFLRVVTEANINQPTAERIDPQLGDVGDLTPDDIANIQDPNAHEWKQIQGQIADAKAKGINPEEIDRLQAYADELAGPNKDAWLQTLTKYQAQQDADNAAGYNNNVRYVQESTNPHKVSLPVQMAMQQYQQPKKTAVKKDSVISKYFVEASEAITEKEEERKQHIRQYASIIAERVRLKENFNSTISPNAGFKPTAGPGIQSNEPVEEAPIAMDPAEPNNPMIHGHEKANPMTLKGRIMSTRRQLKELAQLAESDDLIVWERITKLAKGGMFMGLEQNLEQIRHGIAELAAKRKKGGIQSRGIDKNIG